MTVKPLKLNFTKEEFKKYVEELKLTSFKPKGVVLHNTFMPTLKMVNDYITSGKWRFDQLIDNWWVRYIKLKWPSGPHLFIMPDKIWVASPMDFRGTHSPSYNKTHWGVELVGDFEKEVLPKELRENAVFAMACLYDKLGVEASPANFKFHGEDPRTSHKGCPGKNAHPKSKWIEEVNVERKK